MTTETPTEERPAPATKGLRAHVLAENLKHALQVVSPACSNRSSLPITANVLLATESGRLAVTATNLDLTIKTWIGAKVYGEGATTIGYHRLRDWMRWIGPYALGLEQAGSQLTISAERTTLSGWTMAAEDFPRYPAASVGTQLTFPDPQAFKAAIAKVANCAATDDSRPVLTGASFDLRGVPGDQLREVEIVTADGFRLAATTLSARVQGPDVPHQWILPMHGLRAVCRLIDRRSSDPVVIQISEDCSRARVIANFDSEVTLQLVMGTYPNYGQLFPKEWKTQVRVDVEELRRAVQLAAVCAADGSGIVRLNFADDGLRVGGVADVGFAGRDVADICLPYRGFTGPANRIAFNMRYLLDTLKGQSGELVFQMTEPSAQGVFLLPDGTRVLVMPMFVSDAGWAK